ncbi:AHH domain-containing protein [Capnocytophaga endodontalis]|uniref:Fibronectin type-III domain-containing protein n=1 Tax=Capnocytophaga endodontalis TaxID=2708117 RepID=A0A1Z4BM41_9FLAO|nr:AHH domain-containing protein [Capnocytophaga endodontalis]ASF42330.1 hypothetical protein CBG49_04105 [Capnocytophaga endodontalis]
MSLRRYILLLLTLLSFTLQAQQYPVDVQVFVTPPYPQSLRGYADTFEQKIQAHFLLKDLSTGGRPFALRFSLENFQGQTIAQTPDYITPYLVNLSPGVRRTLTNIDFKTLLRYENLYGINEATYNGLLPEGTYFIGLSLYDVATGRPVSNKGRAMIQVRRYSPPVLTMPQKGEVLTKKNAFQNILFQWMPRDIAPFMQYEFTLKEVWDLALVPEEAFMSGRLVYQTKTNAPALQYTNMMPILLENKRYVWQVRALTNNPANPNEQSYFRNNGNSETFYFDLVSNCEAPRMLTAMTESTSAQLRWSAQAMMPNQEYPYKVMYREKGKSWKSQKVSMPYAKVIGLKRGRTYIYKVGVACGLNAANSTSVFGEDSYVYSTEQEFTTTEQIDEKSQVQCGVKPEIRIKNTEPLQDNLYPNTTFRAGDFPVTVLNATGSNGVYSGEGYVKVPYLQDTKIKVVFNGIKLNTERQLIDGKLVTTYDETERNVVEIKRLDEVINDLKSIFKKKKNTVEDVKSLQELKKLWDFYLSNADEIGISDEDKEKFKSLGEGMFSASVEKLSKEERKALLANTEKAEKLYDKHKNKFEQYIAKKEQEANNDSQINEIVEALLNLKGKAFLKCKKCEEKSIHHTGDKNGVIVNLNIGKYNFKCILGEYHPENNADLITLLRKKESSVSKNETPTTKVKQYIKNIQDKKDSFLLIAQENSDLLECTNRLTFPENFCSVKETETITKEDEKYIIEELKNCLNNNQAVISSDELKNIEKDLLEIKKQLHKEQAFEWTYKGKIYKLNAKNKVEEVQNPLSNAEIIKGIWKGEQEEKMRFYRNEEGIIQLSAFGYRSDLPIVEGKKANLEEISKHILNQTNAYFSDLRIPSQQAPQLDEDAFADGKKIEIGKNATKFQVFIEGVGLTKTLLKTGKVEAKVYLDKSPEESNIKAPGVVTGSLEAGLTVVTDITGMVVMVYDIAVDKKVREETYNGLVKIKDEIKENPKELFPILKEIVLEAATGNSSADWQEASQEQTDKGKQSHLLSKGAVRTTISIFVSGKFIAELPKMAEKLTGEIRKIKVRKLINSLKRFDVAKEFSKGKTKVEEIIRWGKNEIKLTWKRVGNKIDFGDRRDLARILGTTDDIEAHHIIPWQICSSDNIIQKAALDGFHPNMLQNGIGLEKYTKLIGKGIHGNHPAYDKYVRSKLEDFMLENPNITPKQANKFLQEELIPDLKEKIIKAKNSGMNLNEYFKGIN